MNNELEGIWKGSGRGQILIAILTFSWRTQQIQEMHQYGRRPLEYRSRDKVVGIATRLRAGGFRVRILVRSKDFSLLQNVQTGSGAHPASSSVCSGVLSRG